MNVSIGKGMCLSPERRHNVLQILYYISGDIYVGSFSRCKQVCIESIDYHDTC